MNTKACNLYAFSTDITDPLYRYSDVHQSNNFDTIKIKNIFKL